MTDDIVLIVGWVLFLMCDPCSAMLFLLIVVLIEWFDIEI